jgi:hypothetical protein
VERKNRPILSPLMKGTSEAFSDVGQLERDQASNKHFTHSGLLRPCTASRAGTYTPGKWTGQGYI